jgi:MSHA biogenesis protein MshP
MNARPLQHGFAAIAAVFLVVALAALGAFMVAFSNTQQLTSAQDALGTRAYWAARAGLEWGLTTGNATCNLPASATSTTLTVDGFTVTVTCALLPITTPEAGTSLKIVQFISTASSGPAVGAVGYIERSVSASIER